MFELSLGNFTDINASATGFAVTPTFELISHEQQPTDHPYLRKRHYKLTQVVAGAGNYRFQLDQGPTYRRFLVNTTTGSPATDTPGCFSNVKIVSGGRVRNSILSPEVRINSYSQVNECILMNGVDVGRHAKLRRVIVDKYVRIPPGIEIGYNPGEDRRRFTVTESGVVVIPRNACFWD